jgi:hypothetical protein
MGVGGIVDPSRRSARREHQDDGDDVGLESGNLAADLYLTSSTMVYFTALRLAPLALVQSVAAPGVAVLRRYRRAATRAVLPAPSWWRRVQG